MKKVLTCVGTRPNFIKVTQLEKEFKSYPDIEYTLLHTGQHYDFQMSEVFFSELSIHPPSVHFQLVSNSQVGVIASIMTQMEQFLSENNVDLVLVPGDVNSSMACAIVAHRMGIPVGHIESGLRSFDKSMPEEVNRIIIDDVADLYFVTEQSGLDNLTAEQKEMENAHFIGNTMIDTLMAFQPIFERSTIVKTIGIPDQFALATFHRPQNVDEKSALTKVSNILQAAANELPVVLPLHPRTRKKLEVFGLMSTLMSDKNVYLTDPLGYLDFMNLIQHAAFVITDSGGIQEETTFMKVPCITVRPNTERPVTIDVGTNTLVDLDVKLVMDLVSEILKGNYKQGAVPDMWDGNASNRLTKVVAEYLLG